MSGLNISQLNAPYLLELPAAELAMVWNALTTAQKTRLAGHWDWHRSAAQTPPDGAWRVWAFLGGRGAGKTRAGAEWVNYLAARGYAKRIGLIGATLHEVRSVMVEGESGLVNAMRASERPRYVKTLRRLTWASGAVAEMYSAARPNSLRGPQFDLVWADELVKWRHPEAALDNVQLGLRLGPRPRMLVTSTPSGGKVIRRLVSAPETVVTRAPTATNARNLSRGFLASLEALYGGTALARQEIGGEILEDDETALFRRAWFDASRVRKAPTLIRVVVGVDPPASQGPCAAACGIVAAGLCADGDIYVLADASVRGLSPAGWADRVMGAAELCGADEVVAERNQGGDMVRELLEKAGAGRLRVTTVHASVSKRLRATPVALLYEQGRVHHVGVLAEMEDEMCVFGGTQSGEASPDRMDALVWAVKALSRKAREPGVRTL